MKMEKKIPKVCEFCGQEFMAATKRAVYCCEDHRMKAKYRIYYETKKEKKQKEAEDRARKNKTKSVVQVNKEARQQGLSYGLYVARYQK